MVKRKQPGTKKKAINNPNTKKILVTAGATYEPIDPVRFIGNHSSGKMGMAICKKLAEQGFEVILVAGHLQVPVPGHPGIKTYNAKTADEMYRLCIKLFPDVNAAILAAAVADYKPSKTTSKKIKHNNKKIILELNPTRDIAAALGAMKKDQQFLIGFALETNQEIANAKHKLKKKNFDFIILNSLKDKGAGFQTDTNKISIIDRHNNIEKYELKLKEDVASDIIKKVIKELKHFDQ